MRYIDWDRGKPYTFTEEDFDEVINSECMFARKFDYCSHSKLCTDIFDYLMQKSYQK